jgi:hypothetical protein
LVQRTAAHDPPSNTSTKEFIEMFSTRFAASSAMAIAALGVSALITAGPAAAFTDNSSSGNSADQAFLTQLGNDGITPPSSQEAISLAHSVCTSLDKGNEPDAVIAAVAKTTGLSNKSAKVFAVDAASAYCPEYVTST